MLYKLLKAIFYVHEKCFTLLWHIENKLLLYSMQTPKYTFQSVTSGSGLLHKYIMINKHTQKKYFIKKPTLLTDIWQYTQRKLKKTINIPDKYKSLSRKEIRKIMLHFIKIRSLKELSIVLLISNKNTIIYKYIKEIKYSIHNKDNLTLIKRINTSGFDFMDIHNENFIIIDGNIKLIDLESLTLLKNK